MNCHKQGRIQGTKWRAGVGQEGGVPPSHFFIYFLKGGKGAERKCWKYSKIRIL